MCDFIALAERCERALGPDRHLDADIAAAARDGLPKGCDWAFKFPNWEGVFNGEVRIIGNVNGNGQHIAGTFVSPKFTTSCDAATRLFPGDAMYRSGHSAVGPDPSMFFCDAVTDAPLCADVHALAVTEPLARAAAALRARAALSTPKIAKEA